MKRGALTLIVFFILFLLGGIAAGIHSGNLKGGLTYSMEWFLVLILGPRIVVDRISQKRKLSRSTEVVLWSATVLLLSTFLVIVAGMSLAELKPVLVGIALALVWEFIRSGRLTELEEKVDTLLQPGDLKD